MKRLALLLAGLFSVLGISGHAFAHKPSDSYLLLHAADGGASGRWDIALRDLDDALGLDLDADGAVTWGELRAAAPRIEDYARANLRGGTAAGSCRLTFGKIAVINHSDGAYAALPLSFGCPGPSDRLRLHYDLLFSLDAQHRGVVRLADTADAPILLTKARRDVELELGGSRNGSLGAMIALGVDHIWHGYDHLLFLLALLLPSVLRREGRSWVAVRDFRVAFTDIARIVTAFTLAHSLTLGLAAAHWVELPTRFVESAIALSVVLAALNNLWPVVRAERWLAAFALGLLHGFGFAATLSDTGLSGASFARTLFGFNFGVELGQLAVVATLLPVMYGFRRSPRYQLIGLQIGSAIVLLVAGVWLVERALNVRIIS